MRKAIIYLLAIALIFSFGLVAVAQAQGVDGEPAQGEVLLGRSIISGYYAIYSNDNGATYKADESTGQTTPVKLGQAKSVQQSFNSPVDKSKVKQFTRIVVKGPKEVTDDFFQPNGINHIWNQSVSDYKTFNKYYSRHIPDGLTLEGTGDLATGKVDVKWDFELNPLLSPENCAVNLKSAAGIGNYYIDTWSKTPFATASKAWLWTLPVVVEWYGIPEGKPDLALDDLTCGVSGDVQAGTKATARAVFINNSPTTLNNVAIGLFNNGYAMQLKDFAGNPINNVLPVMEPGVEYVVFGDYTVQSDISTITGYIDTPPIQNNTAEEDEENNKGIVDVVPIQPPVPTSNGLLTFQARSQGGNNIYGVYQAPKMRPAGTAKWTDIVTATLKPPAPTPPKGTLKSWSITSVKLTYPRKAQEGDPEVFTFGNPVPPRGTVQKAMVSKGHTATVEFEEDWAMDGAKIYSQIREELMAATPKNYTITAQYTIKYTYEYQVRHRSCHRNSSGKRSCHTWYETVTKTETTDGKATGLLLVNGTGSASLAS